MFSANVDVYGSCELFCLPPSKSRSSQKRSVSTGSIELAELKTHKKYWVCISRDLFEMKTCEF